MHSLHWLPQQQQQQCRHHRCCCPVGSLLGCEHESCPTANTIHDRGGTEGCRHLQALESLAVVVLLLLLPIPLAVLRLEIHQVRQRCSHDQPPQGQSCFRADPEHPPQTESWRGWYSARLQLNQPTSSRGAPPTA